MNNRPEQTRKALKRYCVTRTTEEVGRAYVTAENETHARVLAERHWDDQPAVCDPSKTRVAYRLSVPHSRH
jgi:hypothetical protein